METSPEVDADIEQTAAPQAGTLDLDLIINRLLSYKDNPGKQVFNLPINEYGARRNLHQLYSFCSW